MSRDSASGTNWRIAKSGYKTDKHSTSRTSGDLSGKSQRDNFEATHSSSNQSLAWRRPRHSWLYGLDFPLKLSLPQCSVSSCLSLGHAPLIQKGSLSSYPINWIPSQAHSLSISLGILCGGNSAQLQGQVPMWPLQKLEAWLQQNHFIVLRFFLPTKWGSNWKELT